MFSTGRRIALCCAVLAGALPACGGDDEDPSAERQATGPGPSTSSSGTDMGPAPPVVRSPKRGGQAGEGKTRREGGEERRGSQSADAPVRRRAAKPGEPPPQPQIRCYKPGERRHAGPGHKDANSPQCRRSQERPDYKPGERQPATP